MTKTETPQKRPAEAGDTGIRGSAAPRYKSGRAILVDRLAAYKTPAAGWYRVSFLVKAPSPDAILGIFHPDLAGLLSFTAGTKKRKP